MTDRLPRALEILWQEQKPLRRARGLSRERIVDAAVELADADGLATLSMARLAERLGCGTMSLYRHVANKDELVIFMLSTAAGGPPSSDHTNWRAALTDWAAGVWDIYHRHPWVLQATAAASPADPGQLAWLDAGLAALADTGLSERDKMAAVMALLHFVRGAAALDIEAGGVESSAFPAALRRVVTADRFPALAAAIAGGAFDQQDDRQADFRSGLDQILDGIATRIE